MRLAALLVVGLVTALGGPAGAGEKSGVTMPDTIQVGNEHLTLNGMGLRQATILKVDVYVAGLYVEHPSSDPAKIVTAREPKRIVLQFVRDVDRGKITKAWHEGFEHNATVPLAQIEPMVDRLNSWMSDFSKGETLTFTYVPGQGVAVDVGNARKGVINNDDFARSLFAIWLGPKPPSDSLKNGLLGKH